MPSKWRDLATGASEEPYQSRWRDMAPESEPKESEPVIEPFSDPGFVGALNSSEKDIISPGLKESVGNIPSGLKNYAESIIYPFAHPMNAAESMVNLASGVIGKLPGGTYIKGGKDYNLAGEVDEGEQAVNAVVDHFIETYGSREGFLRAVRKDPVAIATDLSILMTGGGGAITKTGKISKIAKLEEAGRVITKLGGLSEPLNLLMTPLRGIKSVIPPNLAAQFYESAAKFPTSKADTKKNILTALEHQIMPTYSGLIKLGHKIDDVNLEIAKKIDNAVDTGEKIKISSLLKDFDKLDEHARLSFKGKSKLREIRNIKQQLIDTNKRVLADGTEVLIPLTVKQAQKLKQNIYKEFESYYARANSTPIAARTAKLLAKNVKEGIERIIPEIKQLNRYDGDLLALRNEIDKVAPRIKRRDFLSFGTTVKATAGGALFGPAGMAAGFVIGMLDSQPVIKARVALLIHKMRTKGIDVRMTPTVLRLLGSEAGETLKTGYESNEK